jgi:hypothetical protein
MAEKSTKYITGGNQYSYPVVLVPGPFNFSMYGAFVGTVTVQRSYDEGVTWMDVATFTAPGEYVGEEIEAGVSYRYGIKNGEYTSGTLIGRLGQ